MDLLLVALLVLAVAGVVVVALGRVGGGLVPQDAAPVEPLDGALREPADLDGARFQLALRGYRMDQVDGVLDEVRDLLAAKDAEIARLRASGPETAVTPVAQDAPEPVTPVAHDEPEPVTPVTHDAPEPDGSVTPVAQDAPVGREDRA